MRALVLVVAFAAACAACTPAGGGAPPPAPASGARPASKSGAEMRPERAAVVIETPAGERRFVVELAITNEERGRGLMFREHMDEGAGMLFLFEDMRIQSFWMKNTHIPLDMLFIDEDFVIAGIVENAEPLTTVSRKVNKPSRYVLELVGGASRTLGLAAGQKVRFEGVPPHLIEKRVAKDSQEAQ